MTMLAVHLVASALAWFSGRCLLTLLRRPGQGARRGYERLALSYVVGLCVVSAEAMGLSLWVRPQAWHLVLLQVPLLGLALLGRRRARTPVATPRARPRRLAWWEWVLLLLIASKLAYVLVLNANLILRTDDAYKYWLWFAKSSWIAGDPLTREMMRGYPKLPAAMISYFASMAGRWDEFAVNLPYFNLLAALALLFQGALRRFVPRGVALAATYVLVSFPLVLNHAVLTGLADLPLALFVLLCGSALHAYATGGARDELVLACAFALALPLIKLDGAPYAAAALVAIAAALAQRSGRVRAQVPWVVAGVALVAGLAGLLLLARRYPDGGPPFLSATIWERIRPGNHLAEVAQPFFRHFVVGNDNWMLLGTLAALLALPLGLRSAGRAESSLGLLVCLLLASYVYLFAFGGAYEFAVLGATLNRSYLQLLPLLLYAVVVLGRAPSVLAQPDEPVDQPGPAAPSPQRV